MKNEINQENKTDAMASIRSREIVSEILNFGVTQFQIKKIIKFLSLELEDRSLMVNISSLIDDNTKGNTQVKPKIEI
tara:strand:+ start:18 stop:248 length:231 start_codon:yes stop_codon:yes gene_type:complete